MIQPKKYNNNTFVGWLKILELTNKNKTLKKLGPVFTDSLMVMAINLKIWHANNPNHQIFKRKRY